MPRRAHDCPSCQCWQPEPGEEMTVLVNGLPLQPGQKATVSSHDRLEYRFASRGNALDEPKEMP